MGNLRDVAESRRYSDELRRIEADHRIRDDVTEAMVFALARAPEWGARIPGTRMWIWPVRIHGVEYTVFYTYDDDRVELQSILISEPT